MATWPPKPSDGDAKKMQRALASLASLQRYVTSAKDNLAATLDQDNSKAASIQYDIDKLDKIGKYTDQQMVVMVLCADSDQVDTVNTRVSGVLADTDALCRKAVARISTANITTATPPLVRHKKISFRTMDHENVRLWTRQVEDVFNSMGIKQQLENVMLFSLFIISCLKGK